MDYYKTLNVEKSASQDDIKKAYRKLAMKHHPDKGGDSEKFKEINEAFDVLNDPHKKERYDKYGDAGGGPDGKGGSPFGNPFDIFETFFRQSSHRPPRDGARQHRDTVCDYAVSLEDAYCGKNVKINVTHNVRCDPCSGRGSSKDPIICELCRGTGQIHQEIRMGPMVQITRIACESCNGRGKTLDPRYVCGSCSGEGSSKKTEQVSFQVPKHARDGDAVIIENMGDFKNNHQCDLLIRLRYKSHKVFHNDGDNLMMEKTVPLYDALTGSSFVVKHVDGKNHKITINRVVRKGDIVHVKELGMNQRGHLIIRIDVEFPYNLLNATKAEDLAKILDHKSVSVDCDVEHTA